MKKFNLIILSICILFFGLNNAFACKYKSQIDECKNAITNGMGERSIDEFVCANFGDMDMTTYQVIYDLKMQEIDKEIEEFLVKLQDNPTYYFGSEKEKSYIEGVNYLETQFKKHGNLRNRFVKLCTPSESGSIVSEFMSCSENGVSSITSISDYYKDSDCTNIVELKLNIAKKVAYDLFQVAKVKTMKDYRTQQLSNIREKYDSLGEKLVKHLDDIMTINKQWDRVTGKCQTIQ